MMITLKKQKKKEGKKTEKILGKNQWKCCRVLGIFRLNE